MVVRHQRSGHNHAHPLHQGCLHHSQNGILGKLPNPSVVPCKWPCKYPVVARRDLALSGDHGHCCGECNHPSWSQWTTTQIYSSGKGLYKWEHTMDPTANNPCWLFITTVRGQGDQYTRHAYKCAQAAQHLQNISMHPASRHMSDITVSHLCNCPITKEDVRAADDIFGPNLGSLKGKTVWCPNKHAQAGTSEVPQSILKLHRDVVVSLDIMFVNKLPFLVTSSRNIHFSTVESLPNRQVGTVATCFKKVIRLYHHHGFHITSITCNPEFEALQPSFPMLNCCAADKHMPEIERYIRTLKDHTQSAYNVLPFKNLRQLILIHLLKNCTLWLNAFPAADGVSSVLS